MLGSPVDGSSPREIKSRFVAIREKFLEQLGDWLPVYEDFLRDYESSSESARAMGEIHMRVHRIAGSARMFGFSDLTDAAIAAENRLRDLTGNGIPTSVDHGGVDHSDDAFWTLLMQLRLALKDDDFFDIDQPDLTVFSQVGERRFTVLIADDDDLLRELLVKEFTDANFQIMQAPDGEVMMDIIRSCACNADAEKPDLIILDLNMPKVNGFQVLKKLKATEATRDIPVVMLTRRSEDENLLECMSLGAVDYVTKPVSVNELFSRISEQLSTPKNKVLLVDDDEHIREVLTQHFHRMGMSVVPAKSGLEAMQLLSRQKPDAIVLDIVMPGMTGIEVLRQLQANEELAKIPVVLLTTKAQQDNILRGLEIGAHDYVTKPFDPVDVVTRVNQLIQHELEI